MWVLFAIEFYIDIYLYFLDESINVYGWIVSSGS